MGHSMTVGVGDCGVSSDPQATIVTYALGSCVAVTVYDPVTRVGGLLHFMLPDSAIDPDRAKREPHVYADTGIQSLLNLAARLGAERSRLQVKIAGGAQMLSESATFSIGKRNGVAARKLLWKAGVNINGEELGGTVSRTVMLEVRTGRVALKEVAQRAEE
jgi:chemotaxis protein CheD